jgi:two-component system cell cycle sensor histidine kinase/response regulator CckA
LVKIDLAQAQQVILNLVLNARDAMPDGGRVTVSTRNCDGPIIRRDARNQFCDSWVWFAVCDTGCGMDAETLSRLFEPFFTTMKPGKGRLELATVHRIVTHEGGRIEVESKAGRGTRVAVHPPRVEAKSLLPNASRVGDKISPAPNQKIQEPRKARGREKILMTSAIAHAFNPPQFETANLLNLVIVDDERAIRDVCREVARSLGFNTMVAESAEHIYACSTRKS